ncbi:hypothetical protein [Acetobacter fabarum]|uniref:hypothetical protein n=1 Tax=Acetobacter fabarum TaxID=483199 RepID=UPI0039E9A69F
MLTDVQFDAETEALKLRSLLFGSLRLLMDATETVDDAKEQINLLDATIHMLSIAHVHAGELADLVRGERNAA